MDNRKEKGGTWSFVPSVPGLVTEYGTPQDSDLLAPLDSLLRATPSSHTSKW